MQFGQAPVQRPARAQGFGRIEVRGGEHQVAVRRLRRDPRQVEGEVLGQGHRRIGRQRIDADHAPSTLLRTGFGEFQREESGCRRAGGGVVVVHRVGGVIGHARARR